MPEQMDPSSSLFASNSRPQPNTSRDWPAASGHLIDGEIIFCFNIYHYQNSIRGGRGELEKAGSGG